MNNILNSIKNNRLLFIILFATILRLIPFLIYEPWNNNVIKDNILVSDAREYHALALHILETGSYPEHTFLSTKRTPLYPWFLGFVYSVFGVNPYIILLLQILLNLVSLSFVYKISALFFDDKIAILAAFLYAIDPISVLYTQTLLADTMVTTIFLASIWFLVYSLKTKKSLIMLAGGVFLGFAVLTKPVFQYFPVIVFILITTFYYKDWIRVLKYSFLFAFGFILIVMPWLYRVLQ